MSNFILNFIRDFFVRFLTKKPQFFIVVQILAILAWVIIGLPGFLEWACTKSTGLICIELPDAWSKLYNQVAAWATIAIATLSQLPVPEEYKDKLKLK